MQHSMRATPPLNRLQEDEDSAGFATGGPVTSGLARSLRSGLPEDYILREGGGGEMVSSMITYLPN